MPPDDSPTRRVSLRDIAQRLGLSHSTVSLALRDHPRISAPVRAKVHLTARAMGYRPDPMLSALANYRKTRVQAPVNSVIAWLNCWPRPAELRALREFDLYWRGAAAGAEKFGYRLEEFVCGRELSFARLEQVLRSRGIQGILLPPHPRTPSWSGFPWEKFSVVRFGRSIRTPAVNVVSSDQVANAMLAYEAIRARGYARVGYVSGPNRERGILFKAGYLAAQDDNEGDGFNLPMLHLRELAPQHRKPALEDQRRLTDWLQRHRPDAILTDVAAMGGMLKAAGLHVPGDIGLAAFSVLDGNADAGIHQNAEEIGRAAVLAICSLLTDQSRGIPPVARQILVAGRWVDGASLPRRQSGFQVG